MDYMPYVWIAVMIIMAVFEGVTTQLVSVWFVCGALAAAIVSFFVPSFAVQFAVFVGVSLILLLVTKPLVRKARDIVSKFGFLPPVAFFYDYNGAELYESMLETIYRILKKHGKPQGLSELWHRFSAPLIASFELKNVFNKELLFKIRQRLKNYLEKDKRFYIDARSPKKLYIGLAEWEQSFNLYEN